MSKEVLRFKCPSCGKVYHPTEFTWVGPDLPCCFSPECKRKPQLQEIWLKEHEGYWEITSAKSTKRKNSPKNCKPISR